MKENDMTNHGSLGEMRLDCSTKQKKGLHFILAPVLICTLVLFVQLSDLPTLEKNLFTLPLAPH